MGEDKVYEAQIELGKTSDTYDKEGTIMVCDSGTDVSREALEKALLSFVGDIQQVPPMFSAIKVNGRRAYDCARKGQAVDLVSRVVTIHSIKIRGFQPPFVMLEIHCGSGTYIRSLAHDLGEVLGSGGMITALRRLRVGSFTLESAVALPEEWSPDWSALISLETVVETWPRLVLAEEQVRSLKNGQLIFRSPGLVRLTSNEPIAGFYEGKLVALLKEEGRFMKGFKIFL